MKQDQDALTPYPLLKMRCLERKPLDEIEGHIVAAVSGTMENEQDVDNAAVIKHLATAFLYIQAMKNKQKEFPTS